MLVLARQVYVLSYSSARRTGQSDSVLAATILITTPTVTSYF